MGVLNAMIGLAMIRLATFTLPFEQPVAIFLLVLIIILLAPLLLNRLKIPYIIGLIIAGAIVGPHGFNLLANDASFRIFGQVGILYLMFLAGVEIDMLNLRKNLKGGVIYGLLTFAIPMGVGIVASHYAFGASWTTCVLIGSMYSSHTLISYPIVNRFGLTASRGVLIAVCGTIVTVLLSLIALAQVANIANLGAMSWWSVLLLMLRMVGYGIIIGFGFPWITRRFFRFTNESVTQFIFVLVEVFTASLLAQLIGLEAILGAFFAGLVLNRYIPSRSSLMGRIEFVGNAIFIPYFLIGMGMLLNVDVIFDGWGVLWVAVNMVVVALCCKWVAAKLAQRVLHLDNDDTRVMFGLSSGKAAATIAATMVGYQYGLLSEDMMNGAVLMIFVCCAVASISTERAAVRLRMQLTRENLRQDSGPQRRNARQIVAVSNPITAEGLMKLAVLMRHPKNNLPVTALFVRSNDDATSVSMGRTALRLAVDAATSVDLPVREIERYDLNIVAGLLNCAKENNSTDIILGMHRKSNVVDTFYGAVTEQLLSSTNRMIIISRCFIPVDTVMRLIIIVPQKAEYETGFRRWVERMGNLSSQLGCRALFICYKETIPYIRGVLDVEKYNIRSEFEEMASWDDFITLSNQITDEDLLVVIGARRTSISFSTDLENLPNFLSRYFKRHNIVVIYPEQFGDADDMPAPIDPLAQTFSVTPTPSVMSRAWWRWMFGKKKKP